MKTFIHFPLWTALACGPAAIAQSTGTFAPTGPMTTPPWGHSATLLPNGKVLVAGGIAGGDPANGTTVLLASAELYHPSTGAFTPTGSMLTGRWQATTTLLADGRVLIAGGLSGSAEIYDPSTRRLYRHGGHGGQHLSGCSEGCPLVAGWQGLRCRLPHRRDL